MAVMPDHPVTLHTCPLTPAQADALKKLLERDGFMFEPKPYTLFFAKKNKLNVAVYEKGPKAVIQGKGTGEFVEFQLEPEILGEARMGYEEVLDPEAYAPHFGIDESGKGDFFGPLIIAGVFVDPDIARAFVKGGIQDSKRIGAEARIRDLARLIRETPGAACAVVEIKPARYNELYRKIGNLNRLLAWGHARVIEDLAALKPDCPRALSDQFANPRLIQRALMEKGRTLQLEQRTKAENDPAVAAASILARDRLVAWFEAAAREFGVRFPKGASAVKEFGRELVARHGGEVLTRVAKTHFKTASELEPALFPPPPRSERSRFRK